MGEGIGYRAPVGAPKQRQQTIAQCGKRMCGISLCRMPSVFTKCHIPYVMDWILDRPMATPQPFDAGCPGFLWTHTDQSIAHLTAAFATLEHQAFALPPHDLLYIGPVYILDMRGTAGQGSCLQAPMALLTRWPDRIPNLTVGWVGWQAEEHVQILIERGLILLDDHEVVAILRTNLPRSRTQGVQCIERDDRARQIATCQQCRNGTAFITLLGHGDLVQHPRIGMPHQTDQMTRMAITSDTTNGFAISGGLAAPRGGRRRAPTCGSAPWRSSSGCASPCATRRS